MFSPSRILRDTVDLSIYDVVKRLGSLGLTNEEIGAVIGVDEKKFNKILTGDDDLFRILQEAKEGPNRAVETALFKKCTGFPIKETTFDGDGNVTCVKIKETVPSTASIIFWLKNRSKRKWSDHARLDVSISLADRMTAAHERIAEEKKND